MATKQSLLDLVSKELSKVKTQDINTTLKALSTLFLGLVSRNVKDYLSDNYIKQVKSIARKESADIVLGSSDYEVLNTYLNSKLLWDSYSNIDKDISNKINNIIKENYNKEIFDSVKVRDAIFKEVKDISTNKVNTILRTENSNIRRMAFEETYKKIDPSGDFRYRWLSTPDYRRTTICANISRRTSKGVSMEELKKIIKEEADPKTYTETRPFVPHINCRSSIIKL